jgi:hypothetical protein
MWISHNTLQTELKNIMNEYEYFPNQVPKGAFTFNSHNEIM